MKTPRPTRVYANFADGFAEAFSSREYAAQSAGELGVATPAAAVPCMLIPLTPEVIARLRPQVRQAINWWFDGESDYATCLENSTDAAMAAMGIKGRKGRPALPQ